MGFSFCSGSDSTDNRITCSGSTSRIVQAIIPTERYSELQRLGFLVPPPPADPARIEVQAPPGRQRAPENWAPTPAALQPIPYAQFPLRQGDHGYKFGCMAMGAILQEMSRRREQQVPGILAPALPAVNPAVWDQQQFYGQRAMPPLFAPPAVHDQVKYQRVQQQGPGIFSPPFPAPASIDQHLGVQGPRRRRQQQFPGTWAPAPAAAVPPTASRAQAPRFLVPPHLVLVPCDVQPYKPPPYRPPQ
ncbi:hypothetical protein CAEBREN_06221 [Caenorhabditis brenneri]|uniref:Uncharacterized protein n=1 Tax=Caenorhabditis brenneri TaxID=135651 RepID=G0PDZ5_CAEBE|nr:hypothetical protein CAEBREN_06221 [Caenorhabditis brenneri]